MTVTPRYAVTDERLQSLQVGQEFLLGTGNVRGAYTRLQDFQDNFPEFQFRVTQHDADVYRVRRVR